MKLIKKFLNEDHMGNPGDETSMATNQLKNIMKNAQAMLDIFSTNQELDAWVQSNIAVVDSKLQDAKNYVENESTQNPDVGYEYMGGSGDMNLTLGDDVEIINPVPMDDPLGGELGIGGQGENDMLPPPFPDDEAESESDFDIDLDGDGVGDVNVLDIETRYEEDEDED
jgi:hypothetical protein